MPSAAVRSSHTRRFAFTGFVAGAFGLRPSYVFACCFPALLSIVSHPLKLPYQGTKLTFLARSHMAPKFSKVVAKSKKLGAVKKKRDS